MIRFTARALLLPLIIAVCACFGDGGGSAFNPVAPSPPPQPVTPPARAVQLRITGLVVDGSNTPVPGANVQLDAGAGTFTAISDSAGVFAATFEQRWNGVSISAMKAGYERTTRFERLDFAREATRNVRLHPILRLASGSSMRLAINPDDSYCGFDYEYMCRTVRVSAPTAGLLTVEAVADRAGAAVRVTPPFDFSPAGRSASFTWEVAANSETVVNVFVEWNTVAPETLTLNTKLQ